MNAAAKRTSARKTSSKVVSIQAKRKPGGKSRASQLQAETLRAAWNHGAPWSDDDVSLIANAIQNDDTTFNMAISLGRSFYSTSSARQHIGFALRHFAVLQAAWAKS